jgi:branched-chain amino acid transport system permease protein
MKSLYKLIWVPLAIFFILVPHLVGEGWTHVFIEMIIIAIAACGLNLMLGYAGMVNFGAAGFYGVGAYATALILTNTKLPFALAMICGPLAAALAGLVIGWFCIRLTHIYFALLTLAFSQIIYTVIFEWYDVTGGDNGIVGIEIPEMLIDVQNYYYFTLLVFLACMFVLWKIVKSPFGKTIQAIRENAVRTEFVGINTTRFKHMVFVVSCFFLGVAGALFCGFSRSVFPNYAHWIQGSDIMIACLLGGLYSFLGPVVGGGVLVLLEKIIINFTDYNLLVTGLIILMIVLFMRDGITGFFDKTEKVKN